MADMFLAMVVKPFVALAIMLPAMYLGAWIRVRINAAKERYRQRRLLKGRGRYAANLPTSAGTRLD